MMDRHTQPRTGRPGPPRIRVVATRPFGRDDLPRALDAVRLDDTLALMTDSDHGRFAFALVRVTRPALGKLPWPVEPRRERRRDPDAAGQEGLQDVDRQDPGCRPECVALIHSIASPRT